MSVCLMREKGRSQFDDDATCCFMSIEALETN